jgi:hypothetical protein
MRLLRGNLLRRRTAESKLYSYKIGTGYYQIYLSTENAVYIIEELGISF